MSAIANVTTTLASAVADAGTVVISAYPTGTVQATLLGSTGGEVMINDANRWPQGSGAGTVAFTFGASTITITNNSGVTWALGSKLIASFGVTARKGSYNLTIGTEYNQAKAGNL